MNQYEKTPLEERMAGRREHQEELHTKRETILLRIRKRAQPYIHGRSNCGSYILCICRQTDRNIHNPWCHGVQDHGIGNQNIKDLNEKKTIRPPTEPHRHHG